MLFPFSDLNDAVSFKDLKVGLVNSLNFEFPALWRGVQVKNSLWYQPLITPFLLKKLQSGTLLFFVYITLKLPRTKFKNKACPHGKSREVFNLKKGPCSTEFELSCPTLPSLDALYFSLLSFIMRTNFRMSSKSSFYVHVLREW